MEEGAGGVGGVSACQGSLDQPVRKGGGGGAGRTIRGKTGGRR